MNERVSSAFIQKYKSENLFQKSLSLSKFNSTESKTKLYPKKDYFDLVTQIKKKKISLGTPPTLFHQFIKKYNQNSLKLKLNNNKFKNKTQTSLLTENTKDIKSTSFSKYNKLKSFQEKYQFSNSKTQGTPINRILKFKKVIKNITKTTPKKKYISMERRDSYKNFIEKMNQYNYMKCSNSNSDYAHRLKTEILLTQENLKEKTEKKINNKYMEYLRDKLEEEKENKDKVYVPSLELEKLKKKIRNILLKQYAEEPEEFFKIYVNKINFLQDNFKAPNIKNNLLNSKYKNTYGYEELYGLKEINRISNKILDNLSEIRIRKQREKEEKMNFLNKKGEITQRYLYFKKLSKEGIYNSKEEIEKIIYKNYYLKDDDWELLLQQKNFLINDLEEFKNYFQDKYEKNRTANFPDKKVKKFVFQLS